MGVMHKHTQPISDKNELLDWTKAKFPQYKPKGRGPGVVMGEGSTTGLMLVPKGEGQIKSAWAFPSVGIQILVNLSFLAGILPGVIIFLSIWGSVKNRVREIEKEFGDALGADAA